MRQFTTEQITQTRIGSLRSRALGEVRAVTASGLVYVRQHEQIRYNADSGRPEVFAGVVWLPLTDDGIGYWAEEEGLQWDGVLRPAAPAAIVPAEPVAPVRRNGSGDYDELVELTLKMGVAPSSARVYRQTYRAWKAWAETAGVEPLALQPGAARNSTTAQDVSKATRSRMLSALRKLVQAAFVLSRGPQQEEYRRSLEGLRLVKAPAPAHRAQERAGRALAERDTYRVLDCWAGDTIKDRRNAALLAVLALSGMRRSEAAALQWRDVDFEHGLIRIRHGKGDKSREAPVYGERALDALRALQMALPGGFQYVFCPLTTRGDGVRADRPIAGGDIYRVVVETERRTGVEFRPHDLRRTFVTSALASGNPVHEVQQLVGHARGETTLRYARSVNAREARRRLKLGYS